MKTGAMIPKVNEALPLTTAIYIRFGHPSHKCQRNGICEIVERTNIALTIQPNGSACGYLTYEAEQVQLRLLRASMSEQTLANYFYENEFIVEKDYQTDLLFSGTSPTRIYVREGTYPVKRTTKYMTIFFD